ncbi:ABC transporter ATP-binding protein [Desulfosporosinus sp. PR]|uniref:ABC transporter ATP-binding protein n=1 Tax=Candidatus Desulfosporosinus nitrosoreducens TaxID=3401928 RepID=UPI0027FFFA47|nr:ABC transporter ATP-binding protein [Desulfosporosinus sp. PR]MDQ7094494.1 ABC transporter ATP-binding protein [Desulfosporosinus sp. PR]
MIEVKDLSKTYIRAGAKSKKTAGSSVAGLKAVTFQVREGEVFGLLGPNGAGKTTVIRHLMGFIKADAGYARIHELDCWHNSKEVKALVGYLPGEMNFLKEMSGLEFLNLMAGMHGDRPVFFQRRAALAEDLDLNLKQPIKKMSKGMKQKLGIINTLMLDAEVLILDEPTSGLDPLMQKVFIDLVLEEKKRGKTILISSHMFPEIERTCDQVGMIRAGELVAVEEIQKLRQEQQRTFEIVVETPEQAEFIFQSGLKVSRVQENQVIVEIQGDLNPLLKTLAQVQVREFTQKMTELEEAFMFFYERGEGFEQGIIPGHV